MFGDCDVGDTQMSARTCDVVNEDVDNSASKLLCDTLTRSATTATSCPALQLHLFHVEASPSRLILCCSLTLIKDITLNVTFYNACSTCFKRSDAFHNRTGNAPFARRRTVDPN